MTVKYKSTHFFIDNIKLIGFGLLIGILGGVLGALFSKTLTLVTDFRSQNNWLVYFLPFAGLLSVAIYKFLKTTEMSTNTVIKSCKEENTISPALTPAIFICSAISHLFGASVGREGAALQLGGGLATILSKLFRLDDTDRQILTYCGMAGLFSAVFGTPIAAFVFALQIVYVWRINYKAILPCFITSFTAYITSVGLGTHPERFEFNSVSVTFSVIFKTIIISIFSAFLAMLFCYSLKYTEKSFKRLFKNSFLRIAVGGIITVLLTIIVKSNDYNGAGVKIIEHIFTNGEFKPEAFILKLVFTCVAVGTGFKGGEIVPTLFIGATFGSLAASLLGIPVTLGAVIGMTALFGGVTNCPLAAIFLSLEMFSGKGLIYIVISAIISYLFSGRISLYSAQKVIDFKKFIKNS